MPYKNKIIHTGLFLLTVISTTLAGAEWMTGNLFLFSPKPLGWTDFLQGFNYSLPFLLALTVHEFGHYFVAKYYQIKVTLPYYIPFWFSGLMSIGTMGAFIRLQSTPKSRKQYFDIGIAGPLAGFVVAIAILWYGFTHLPPPSYIYKIHPEYLKFGPEYANTVYKSLEGQLQIGDNLIFWFFKTYLADHHLMPNAFEIMHYPYLMAGYLALFFTALNLIPIGQLDGGHILYALIGKKNHSIVSPILLIILTFYSGLGIFHINDFEYLSASQYLQKIWPLVLYIFFLRFVFSKIIPDSKYDWVMALAIVLLQFISSYLFPNFIGYSGFLPFCFLLGRFLGVFHPDAAHDEPLDLKRKILAIISLVIFVLCFSPAPFIVY